MADTTILAVWDGLVSALQARSGLSGVTVRSGPVEPRTQGIELIRIEEIQDFANLKSGGPSRDEDYSIVGHIWTTQNGSNEATIKTVRDRAFTYLKEIADYLRATPTIGVTGVLWSELAVVNMTQGWVGATSRNCELRFRISVRARI